jgi:hypothetical protein
MQEFLEWLAGDYYWVAGIAIFFLLFVVALFIKGATDDGSGRWRIGDD